MAYRKQRRTNGSAASVVAKNKAGDQTQLFRLRKCREGVVGRREPAARIHNSGVAQGLETRLGRRMRVAEFLDLIFDPFKLFLAHRHLDISIALVR